MRRSRLGVPHGMAQSRPVFMATRGDAFAQRCLGQCYENGEGVPRDLEKALRWYSSAAANGQHDAIEGIGRLWGSVGSRP